MISFSLACENGHGFDGWFRNGAAFDEQAAAGELACPVCGSQKVEKALMAPNIPAKANKKSDAEPAAYAGAPDPKVKELIEQVRQLRQHVEDTAEYVGDKFPEEARKIHYEETEKRGIFGEASLDEARELVEEGVEVLPIPQLPEDHN